MTKRIFIALAFVAAALALVKLATSQSESVTAQVITEPHNSAAEKNADHSGLAVATFAGGCFWCIESTFEKLDGVSEAVSGYSGGHTDNPTYREVGGGSTGHTEAVQVFYDPKVVSYQALLHQFWKDIDPTDASGQFVDRGSEYRPAIFYRTAAEQEIAIMSRDELAASGRYRKPIAVEIVPLDKFYDAEDYHQDYYKKSPLRYKVYRHGSGRDQYLEKIWGDQLHLKHGEKTSADGKSAATLPAVYEIHEMYKKPDDQTLKTMLSEMQYAVTQHDGTEPPFQNEFWDNKRAGIYVDVVSGEPLFSSADKYKSGTGWPSFSKPINAQFMVEKQDYKLLFPRTELRSKYGDSHLGHIFNDGPAPTGLRYCINSAALKFIEKEEMEDQGYADYLALFSE